MPRHKRSVSDSAALAMSKLERQQRKGNGGFAVNSGADSKNKNGEGDKEDSVDEESEGMSVHLGWFVVFAHIHPHHITSQGHSVIRKRFHPWTTWRSCLYLHLPSGIWHLVLHLSIWHLAIDN